MTTPFEQRLSDACDRFLAARDQFVTEVLHAARDASVVAVEHAFALAMSTRSRLATASRNDASATVAGAPAAPAPPLARSMPTPTPTRAPLSASESSVPTPAPRVSSTRNADRVLACICEAPGAHVGQLSQKLAMSPSAVRRHVRRLMARDVIRIEGARGPLWGQPRRTFFPCEPRVGVESSASAPEASA